MPKTGSSKTSRSAVTNATRLLPASADGRSRFARRYRDLVHAIESDLGGADRLSVLQRQLVRRAAALAARSEENEADLAAGRAIDSERFASDVALLVRVSRQLGLHRVAVEVNSMPTLADIIAEHERAEPVALQIDANSFHGDASEALSAIEEPSTAETAGGEDAAPATAREGVTIGELLPPRAGEAA